MKGVNQISWASYVSISYVPRFKADEVEIQPVFFADDKALLFDGESTQGIIDTVDKITQYEDISGLKLNLSKCEFIAVNCPQATVDQLQNLGMKKVRRILEQS